MLVLSTKKVFENSGEFLAVLGILLQRNVIIVLQT